MPWLTISPEIIIKLGVYSLHYEGVWESFWLELEKRS